MEAQRQMATGHTLYVYVYFVGMYTLHACVISCFSHVRLFATPWTVAHQAPLSMELSRQEYWSGLLFPSPGNLPHPGTEAGSAALREMLYQLSHQGYLSPEART